MRQARENGEKKRSRPLRVPLRLAPWLGMLGMAAASLLRRRPAGGPRSPEEFDAAEPGRGRLASAPWEIPGRGWKDIAWRTYNEFGRTRLQALAGGVTFYVLLATFPAVAAFVTLYGMISDVAAMERLFQHLGAVFPRDVIDLVVAQMAFVAAQHQSALGFAFVLSAAISAWSANAGMKALIDGINVAYNEREKRPYVPRTLVTYAATVAATALMVLITAASLAVPAAFQEVGLHHLARYWAPLRWLLILSLTTCGFALLYRYGPSRAPPRWRWVIFGAVFASIAWMASSIGFSWYLDRFRRLGATYGSLGAIIGFMLWVWLSVLIVLMGAELNSEIEHQTACDTTVGRGRPIGERGAVMADAVGVAFTVSPRQALHNTAAFLARQAHTVANAARSLVKERRPN
jgi:membrane protein